MQSASTSPRSHGRRSAVRRAAVPAAELRLPVHHRIGVALAVIALVTGFSIVPTDAALAATLAAPATTLAPGRDAPAHTPPQRIDVDATIAAPVVSRDQLSATDGVQTLSNNGTNADWAKLVLMFGGWPQTDANVQVMLRWMRQENGPPDWWNRNNPLNNGYGSGGGAGLGSYPDLTTAAEYAAKNLQRGYPGIVAGLTAGTSADATAAAIWASPWATSHYGNGSHWSTAPVQLVKAPASAWGN
ncbi:hypothetical protein [Leifsonia sp. Root227]|uniref:hypothetical protein n=1 Tax=Leifsonia sp. Root227 TaxID=1736496 RepID=UPI000AF2603B|nr:hypothetical protein [Leifsonia sp. Root227]